MSQPQRTMSLNIRDTQARALSRDIRWAACSDAGRMIAGASSISERTSTMDFWNLRRSLGRMVRQSASANTRMAASSGLGGGISAGGSGDMAGFLPAGSKARSGDDIGRSGAQPLRAKLADHTHERLLKKEGLRLNSELATRPQPLAWQDYEEARLEGDGSQRGLGLAIIIGFCLTFYAGVALAIFGAP